MRKNSVFLLVLLPGMIAVLSGTPAKIAPPKIGEITDNRLTYPGGQVPRYEKLEVTFSVSTKAGNLFLPYDPAPPRGVNPGIGISVDAVLTAPNGSIYRQPAFVYQDFKHQVKSDKDWIYPTEIYVWKVRFSPNQAGTWRYRIVAQDAGGTTQSPDNTVVVTKSPSRGFVRVSRTDARYFEFDDGTYFPGLGYNINENQEACENPVVANLDNFKAMGQNGIQVLRIWLSQWAVYGSAWNPWRSHVRNGYFPNESLTLEEKRPGSDLAFKIAYPDNPCILWGWRSHNLPVKRNTRYRVDISYKTSQMGGPRSPGLPHGLVAKLSGWAWSANPSQRCTEPGIGMAVTSHAGSDSKGWQLLTGSFDSGQRDFLDYFYVVLDNITTGIAYLDHISIREELKDGGYGPNLIPKPSPDVHRYIDQRNAYAFDRLLDLAHTHGIYLRPVVMDKMDWVFRHIDLEGNWIPNDPACWDTDPANDPEKCPKGARWFYGQGRLETKTRWLQKAWWRYLQARWGYSPNIHSWELINEGDPNSKDHWVLADEFGQFMHSAVFGVPVVDGEKFSLDHPNDHLVSTSFWLHFPARFHTNASGEYDNVDFADIHRYIRSSDPDAFSDPAQATAELSMQLRKLLAKGASKPIIRGEVGLREETSTRAGSRRSERRTAPGNARPGRNRPDRARKGDVIQDGARIWLHDLIWAGVNSGGMIDSYWYVDEHIYRKNSRSGDYVFDHRSKYGNYYRFISTIPLNNGKHQDAAPRISNASLRAWGQKDLVNGNAHLWIQNRNHTWKNVMDGAVVAPQSGTVTVTGFTPGQEYQIEWWDTSRGSVSRSESVPANSAGEIVLRVDGLLSDVAVKVLNSGNRRPEG